MPRRALIALGGNQGDVARVFQSALELLQTTPGVSVARVAPLFRTAPVGDQAGAPVVNSAAELSTSLDPLPLLDRLQQIETALGRTRGIHWGPRTLDLDLIGVDDLVIRHPRLTLPHPHAWHRRFVLDPLAEIAADWTHPVWRLDVAALRRRLLVRPLPVVVAGGERRAREALAAGLAPHFPHAKIRTTNDEVAARGHAARATDATSPTRDSAPLTLWLGRSTDPATSEDDAANANDVTRTGDAPRSGDATSAAVPRVALRDFPESPEIAARHVLEAALGESQAMGDLPSLVDVPQASDKCDAD